MPDWFTDYALSLILRTPCNSGSYNMHYVNSQLIDCVGIVECYRRHHTTYGLFRGTSLEWISTSLDQLWLGRHVNNPTFRLFERCCQVDMLHGKGFPITEYIRVQLGQ